MRTRKLRALTALLAVTMALPMGSVAANAESADEGKVLKLTFSDTPQTLNPHTTASDYELLSDMTALLYRKIYSEEEGSTVFVPELAEGDPVPTDDTFLEWTVKIQEGFTFTDGTPIDANVVEYSIKMLDDPKLANRNVTTDLVNAEEYLMGECEWEDVGFQAIDDYTLQINFVEGREPATVKDMKELWSFIGYGVVHPETYEACLNDDGTACSYGADLDSFVASALYEPTELIQGQFLALTKRTDGAAPLADVYTPDRVEYYAVTDKNTQIQMFQQGEIDAVVANDAAYDGYDGARFVYNPNNYGIYINPTGSGSNPILTDVNFRYAMFWGLDRETIVKAVFPTALPSAYQYMPFATMPDPSDPDNKVVNYYETEEAKAIRIDGHEMDQLCYDKDLALEYFEKAYEANGGEKVTLVMKYTDSSDTVRTWAEALQAHYQNLFGTDRFELELQAVPWAIIYEDIARDNMNYDICASCGWYESVTAPWNNSNWVYSGPYTYNTQYCVIASEDYQKEWDDLFYKCATGEWKRDAEKKLEACARMEEILLNDCSFVPAYASGNRWFFSQKITPLMEEGDPDLSFCLMQATFN